MGGPAAIASAHEHIGSATDNVQAGRVSLAKIEKLIRQSKLVSRCTTTEVILWYRDDTNEGTINMDEIAVLQYNEATGDVNLSTVEFPANSSPSTYAALNAQVALRKLIDNSGKSIVLDSAYCTSEPIGAGLTGLEFSCDPNAPFARTIFLSAVFGSGDSAISLDTAATLRADRTHWVTQGQQGTTLSLPSHMRQGGGMGN